MNFPDMLAVLRTAGFFDHYVPMDIFQGPRRIEFCLCTKILGAQRSALAWKRDFTLSLRSIGGLICGGFCSLRGSISCRIFFAHLNIFINGRDHVSCGFGSVV